MRPLDDDPDQDPFWDPAEDLFLGSAYVYLQPLAYGLDVDEVTMPISNYRGVTVGQLHVKVALCDEAGKALAPVAEVHAPDDLLKQRVDILVRVIGASNVDWLADDASRGTYIKYRFYTDSKMRQTRTVHDTDTPRFEYSKQFTIRAVSNNFLNYLNTNALVLELWGTQGSGSVPFRRTMRQALPQGTPLKPNGSTGSESSGAGAETEADSSRARSRATDRSVSGEGRGAERVMDTVLQESAWLEERTRLLETISTLQQEVAFLSIEKGALEKVRVVVVICKGGVEEGRRKSAREATVEVCFLLFFDLHRRLMCSSLPYLISFSFYCFSGFCFVSLLDAHSPLFIFCSSFCKRSLIKSLLPYTSCFPLQT